MYTYNDKALRITAERMTVIPFPFLSLIYICRLNGNARDKGHVLETMGFGAQFLQFEDENPF